MADNDFKDKEFKDRLDSWQYRIFQLLLFTVFCIWVLKNLDEEIHLSANVRAWLAWQLFL